MLPERARGLGKSLSIREGPGQRECVTRAVLPVLLPDRRAHGRALKRVNGACGLCGHVGTSEIKCDCGSLTERGEPSHTAGGVRSPAVSPPLTLRPAVGMPVVPCGRDRCSNARHAETDRADQATAAPRRVEHRSDGTASGRGRRAYAREERNRDDDRDGASVTSTESDRTNEGSMVGEQ